MTHSSHGKSAIIHRHKMKSQMIDTPNCLCLQTYVAIDCHLMEHVHIDRHSSFLSVAIDCMSYMYASQPRTK